MKEINIFETSNIDLATYLVYEGIKLLECVRKAGQNQVVILRFVDEKNQCPDLERVFINSDFKRFRETNKWLLKKVHLVLNRE